MNLHEYPINRTYGLTLEHISKVSTLSDYLEINQSEVIRMAIDKLYEEIRPLIATHPAPTENLVAELRADYEKE
jgi:hypothetical protein